MLHARALLLRNCGRFTHISSDFGSQYHTHTFVTSEALYASLTRGVTWRHPDQFVNLDADAAKSMREDYFLCDYDVQALPLWFTPGLFVDPSLRPLAKQRGVVDRTSFNVVDEGYPSTGGRRMDGKTRASTCPTYGRIEGILPDHRLFTWAVSLRMETLKLFEPGQTFLLGKKRTMVQIVGLSEVGTGQAAEGVCETPYLQLRPNEVNRFSRFEILAATARYVLAKGELRDVISYWRFEDLVLEGNNCPVSVPEFYLEGKIL